MFRWWSAREPSRWIAPTIRTSRREHWGPWSKAWADCGNVGQSPSQNMIPATRLSIWETCLPAGLKVRLTYQVAYLPSTLYIHSDHSPVFSYFAIVDYLFHGHNNQILSFVLKLFVYKSIKSYYFCISWFYLSFSNGFSLYSYGYMGTRKLNKSCRFQTDKKGIKGLQS